MAYTEQTYGKQSTLNSTTVNLAAGATFTGTAESVIDFASLKVVILSSHASATDGFQMQFSPNGTTNWGGGDAYNIPANTIKTFGTSINTGFFRVVYVNGGTTTTSFLINTILHTGAKQGSSVRPQDSRGNDNDAEETISYNSCYDPATNTWSRMRGVGGILQVINYSGRTTSSGKYMHSSFRIQGNATAGQNLFTIESPTASGKKIGIERMTITNDSTAVLTSVSPSIKTSRTTAIPTGGTVVAGAKFETAQIEHVAVIRNATASDGGAATVISATAAQTVWTQFVDRMHTAVGQIVHNDNSLLPQLVEDHPFVLAPGEGLLVQCNLANAVTTHFVINIVWEEYT